MNDSPTYIRDCREERNEAIRSKYTGLLKSGMKTSDAIEVLYDSPENKSWCLERDTIRLIATYKNYGKQTARSKNNVNS